MTNKFKSARLGAEGIGAVTRLGRMMDLTLEMSMNWSDATWPRRVSSHKISQIFVEKKPCCPKLLLAYKSKLLFHFIFICLYNFIALMMSSV